MPKAVVAVVNDAYEMIAILTRALQRAGYDVIGITARDLRAGTVRLEELAKAQRISAIVYDVGVPYRENWDYLRMIRESASELPPIVVTTTSKRILDVLIGETDRVEITGDALQVDRVVAAVRRVVPTGSDRE